MPSSSKKHRNMKNQSMRSRLTISRRLNKKGGKRSSRRRNNMRGGGCGCGGNIFSQNKMDNSQIAPPGSNMLQSSQFNGGQSRSRHRRQFRYRQNGLKQRGGSWDAFFTGNYAINPIANTATTSGAFPNANMLFGRTEVDPSPNKQAVAFYNSANMRIA